MKVAARFRFDRTSKRPRKNKIFWGYFIAVVIHATRKPAHAFYRIVQNTCSKARLLQLTVSCDNEPNPSGIDRVQLMAFATQNNACIRCIVGNCIQHHPRASSFRVQPENPHVQNFEAWGDIIGGDNHVAAADVCAL